MRNVTSFQANLISIGLVVVIDNDQPFLVNELEIERIGIEINEETADSLWKESLLRARSGLRITGAAPMC